jgi:hypothetical protein
MRREWLRLSTSADSPPSGVERGIGDIAHDTNIAEAEWNDQAKGPALLLFVRAHCLNQRGNGLGRGNGGWQSKVVQSIANRLLGIRGAHPKLNSQSARRERSDGNGLAVRAFIMEQRLNGMCKRMPEVQDGSTTLLAFIGADDVGLDSNIPFH